MIGKAHAGRSNAWKRAALLLPVLLAGGCASSAMKGTPFFTGEYEQRQGPVEDRVNAWPLLYYREPALSLLWPIGEYVQGEQLAVRPLFSVYNLDQPDGREWNVLWPFIQHDQQSGAGRVFPFLWWGDHYFDVFPLYWHHVRRDALSDILFPLWWYERSQQGRRLTALLGLAGYAREAGRTSWWLWPLAGDLERADGSSYRYQLWPLAHQLADPAAGRHAHGVFPLWWYSESPERWQLLTLPWAQGGTAGGDSWRMMFPLFWAGHSPNRDSLYTLLGGYSAAGAEKSWIIPLLLSGGKSDGDARSTTLLGGLGRWSRDGEKESHSHVLPLYWRSQDEEGSRFYSLPWSRAEQADGSGWTLAPGYFGRHYRDGHLTLSPLYASGSDRPTGESWHAVLPLYYASEHAGGHTFATLLGGRETAADGQRWSIYPLLSRVGERGGTNDWWLLAPLSHFRWDGTESRSHVFPLYYRDTATDTLISPLYADWLDEQGRNTLIPPLLSWRSQRGPADDWWLLGGLGHLSLGEQPGTSHVIPVYYHDPAKGLTLSPLYCRWAQPGGAAHFVLPLLSGYSTGEQGRELWSLAGLYGHEWRSDGRSADRLLPLYAWAEDEYFYTALAGWNEKGFRYYLTPLVSSWDDRNESGFRVWPLFSRTHFKRTDATRTRVLWAVNRSDDDYRRSVFFPLYGYTYLGSLDREPPADRWSEAGRDFFCLPVCWYRDTRSSYLVGEGAARRLETKRVKSNGAFPLWSYEREEKAEGWTKEHSLLWFLYDRRQEAGTQRKHAYVRHRVLWRLYHYEKLDGNVSVDMLPGITYDARTDGFRKTSFLWRVFRWEKAPDGARKLDLLFIPLLREGGD